MSRVVLAVVTLGVAVGPAYAPPFRPFVPRPVEPPMFRPPVLHDPFVPRQYVPPPPPPAAPPSASVSRPAAPAAHAASDMPSASVGRPRAVIGPTGEVAAARPTAAVARPAEAPVSFAPTRGWGVRPEAVAGPRPAVTRRMVELAERAAWADLAAARPDAAGPPPDVSRPAGHLDSFDKLLAAVRSPDAPVPAPAAVKKCLADLADATGDPALVELTAAVLARKADAPDAAPRLRDLIAAATPRADGDGGLPRGVELLMPEAPAAGVRPTVADGPLAGLTPLDELAAATALVAGRLTQERARSFAQVHVFLHPPLPDRERDRDKDRDRPPGDRALARALRQQGKTDAEVEAALRQAQ